MEGQAERSAFSAGFVTGCSISSPARALLRVYDADTFVDFTFGAGAFTLAIVGDSHPRIVNAEINGKAAAASAMFYIMKGYEKV